MSPTNNRPTVMIVDDEALLRRVMEGVLASAFNTISLSSGEDCLDACAAERPDMVLLDVEMPEMNGYEVCRRLKAELDNPPPVIFVSGQDHIEDRMEGYEAGGDDYVLKPVNAKELLAKIALRLKDIENRGQLQAYADMAGATAMSAMTSMGEMGVVLQALQRFGHAEDLDSLAREVLAALASFGLEGLVQLKTGDASTISSTHGAASPMEQAIIGQVSAMGRIVEYRSRMSISYDHAALLISNTPIDDSERRGRLRDHLATLAESADLRVRAIEQDALIARAVQRTSFAIDEIDARQRKVQIDCNLALHDMNAALEQAYIALHLSEQQESELSAIVSDCVERVSQTLMAGNDIQAELTRTVAELTAIAHQGNATNPDSNRGE